MKLFAAVLIGSFSFDAGKYGYENRNKDYDISEKIFIKNSDWIIQTTNSRNTLLLTLKV